MSSVTDPSPFSKQDWHARVYASGGAGNVPRRPPKKKLRDAVLADQDNRCIYCEHEFGTVVCRDGRYSQLKVHWDHYVPYVYQGNNRGLVASCNVCNQIKHAKMFGSLDEARRHILSRWRAKGYYVPPVEDNI